MPPGAGSADPLSPGEFDMKKLFAALIVGAFGAVATVPAMAEDKAAAVDCKKVEAKVAECKKGDGKSADCTKAMKDAEGCKKADAPAKKEKKGGC
jgi:uncharacterized protein YgiB involved in biofilm formation